MNLVRAVSEDDKLVPLGEAVRLQGLLPSGVAPEANVVPGEGTPDASDDSRHMNTPALFFIRAWANFLL